MASYNPTSLTPSLFTEVPVLSQESDVFSTQIHNFERSFSLSSGPKAVLFRLAIFLLEALSKALVCITLNYVNPVLYPSIDTILCVLLNMPAASATAKISFSVLRRLKTCISSAMKNDRLYSLGLMHIHRGIFNSNPQF
jgi:hypothetical protein